jgi:hypothetical protein
MHISTKVIPQLVGGDVANAYANVDLEKHIPTWYRGRLDGDIKKTDLREWISTSFIPDVARDSCARVAIPSFRVRQPGDEDRVIKATINETSAYGLKKQEKIYDDNFNKKCNLYEKAMGLESIDFDVLLDAAEYYNVKEGDSQFNEEAMKVVFEKAGISAIYNSATNHVKEFLQAFMQGPLNSYNAIQMFALIYCKGDDISKFLAFLSLVNDRETRLDYLSGKGLQKGLVCALNIFGYAVQKLAAPGDKSFEKIDIEAAVKVWLLGKVDNIPEQFKRIVLEKWFLTSCKFSPCEGRQVILDFLKAHPDYVTAPPAHSAQ